MGLLYLADSPQSQIIATSCKEIRVGTKPANERTENLNFSTILRNVDVRDIVHSLGIHMILLMMWNICKIFVRYLWKICKIFARYLWDIFKIFVRYLLEICEIFVWKYWLVRHPHDLGGGVGMLKAGDGPQFRALLVVGHYLWKACWISKWFF